MADPTVVRDIYLGNRRLLKGLKTKGTIFDGFATVRAEHDGALQGEQSIRIRPNDLGHLVFLDKKTEEGFPVVVLHDIPVVSGRGVLDSASMTLSGKEINTITIESRIPGVSTRLRYKEQ